MVELKREYEGAERTFKINDPALFERLTPTRSLYFFLQKFSAGEWSIEDVAFVLSYALHGPTSEVLRDWSMAKQAAKFGTTAGVLYYRPHPAVLATVTTAPGNFAPIAIDILTELVFGAGASAASDEEASDD